MPIELTSDRATAPRVLIIGLELFILSRVQIKVLASQTKIQSFDHVDPPSISFIETFPITPSN